MLLWFYLGAAALVGAIPPSAFWRRGTLFLDAAQVRVRYFMVNPADHRRRRRWWKSVPLWLDPARGAVVGYLLGPAWRAQAGALNEPTYRLIHYVTLVLMLGFVFAQTTGRGREAQTLTPLLFVAGLIGGAFDPTLGLSAALIGLTVVFAAQSLMLAAFAMAATVAAAGWFLLGPGVPWLVAITLCLLPWGKAFALRHELVVALRG